MERLAFNHFGGADGAPTNIEARPARVASVRQPDTDRVAYLSLLAFIFVLLVRPQDQALFLTPLHLAELFGTAAVLSLAIGRIRRGRPISRLTPEIAGVFVFAAVIVGTIPLSFWPGGSLRLFTDQLLKIVLVTMVIVNTVTTRVRLEQLTAVLLLGTSYVASRAVFDYGRGVNLILDQRVTGAVGGLFGNPNDMALTMVTFLPLAMGLALAPPGPYLRALGIVAVPALTGAIILSHSRGGMLGLAAVLLVMLYHLRRLRPGVAATILVAGLAVLPVLPSSFMNRMSSIVNAEQDETGSREARKIVMREAFQTFLSNPFIGIGVGQFTNYNPDGREEAWRQTHNAPLQVAAELGLVGVSVFLYMIGAGIGAGLLALRTVRRRRRRERVAAAPGNATSSPATGADRETLDWLELTGAMVIAAFTGWIVSSMFASVAYYWTLYLLLAVASAVRVISLETAGAARSAERKPAPTSTGA
jgi:putative inorganic carbon (HCO3(-)) transporter